jgi:DNA-binding NtrC family response regulator
MRPTVLSIASERLVSPLRNAVLAHAGYAVIPATSITSALKILRHRHVCAMVVGQSMDRMERRLLCSEAHKYGVPAMVLDPYGQEGDDNCEMHLNPLDGPELLLDALDSLVRRGHELCLPRAGC